MIFLHSTYTSNLSFDILEKAWYDPESITDLPTGYKKLAYQIDAVNDGYNKLLKHSGFILADVVGLGKTIVATIIAKKILFLEWI